MALRERKRKGGAHDRSPNPRRHALEVVSRALSPDGRGFAQDLLAERLAHAPMGAEDRRLAVDLTYGVIRRRDTLDAVLAAYSTRPLDDVESVVRQILRLGAYQILFQRIPDHAAADESVTLARATGKSRATGFVNAVLRSIARDVTFRETPDPAQPRESFELRPGRACVFGRPVLPPPADPAAYLAALCSFPAELAGRWIARYGMLRARTLCEVANEQAPIFIRANNLGIAARLSASDKSATPADVSAFLRCRLHEEGIEVAPSPTERTLRLPERVQVARLRSFEEGLFQVQDDSSAAVALFLDPRPGETVLDLCAAPGGKTCHMADLMANRGRIMAVDVSAKRLQRVVENMRRLNHPIIAIVESDGVLLTERHPAAFDRVLLDAPCSNTGVLRRRVEARWRFSIESLAALAQEQNALLKGALQCLKPGGTLVYSTCSLEPEENSLLVASVLRGVRGFALDAEPQLLPSRDGGDGIYMARVRRTEGDT